MAAAHPICGGSARAGYRAPSDGYPPIGRCRRSTEGTSCAYGLGRGPVVPRSSRKTPSSKASGIGASCARRSETLPHSPLLDDDQSRTDVAPGLEPEPSGQDRRPCPCYRVAAIEQAAIPASCEIGAPLENLDQSAKVAMSVAPKRAIRRARKDRRRRSHSRFRRSAATLPAARRTRRGRSSGRRRWS